MMQEFPHPQAVVLVCIVVGIIGIGIGLYVIKNIERKR